MSDLHILAILRSPTPTELQRIIELDAMFEGMSKRLKIPKSKLWWAAVGIDNNVNLRYSYTHCKCGCKLYLVVGNNQSCARCGEPADVSFSGRVYKTSEWIDAVKKRYFIDYDGYGELCDGDYCCKPEMVRPSDVGKVDLEKFPYIVWFNR